MTKIETLIERYDTRLEIISSTSSVVHERVSSIKSLLWWLLGGLMTVGAGVAVLVVKYVIEAH